MLNIIGEHAIGRRNTQFSPRHLANTKQWLKTIDGEWIDKAGQYTAPSTHQWEGGCYDFDGVNDYIIYENVGDTLGIASAISFSIFFDYDATSNDGLLTISDGGGNVGKIVVWLSGHLYISFNGTTKPIISNSNFVSGYNHLVITYDGTTLEFKLNDYTVSHAASGSVDYTGLDLYIGKYWSTTSYTFNGRVYDVRIFKRLLTAKEISDLGEHKVVDDPIFFARCDEGIGTTSYDSSGNENNGVIMNATQATFHATQRKYSFANEIGYTNSGGVIVPRDESNTGDDVQGNPLQYKGRARYDAQLVESHCATFDGINDYISIQETEITGTSYTIAIWAKANSAGDIVGGLNGATNTYLLYIDNSAVYHKPNQSGGNYAGISIAGLVGDWHHYVVRRNGNGNNVDIFIDGIKQTVAYVGTLPNNPSTQDLLGQAGFAGFSLAGSLCDYIAYNSSLTDNECVDLYNSKHKDGAVRHYPLTEGDGITSYDVSGNSEHGTIANATLSSFWGATQDNVHRNLTKGFRLSSGVKIPALASGATAADGNALTNPARDWHNGAETKIKQRNAPALLVADEADDYWFSSDVAQAKGYSDLVENVNDANYTLANVSTDNQRKDIIVCHPALSGTELAKAERYLKHS